MQTKHLLVGTFGKARKLRFVRTTSPAGSFIHQARTRVHHAIWVSTSHHSPEGVKPKNWVSILIRVFVVVVFVEKGYFGDIGKREKKSK
jgi:hypothetical protein